MALFTAAVAALIAYAVDRGGGGRGWAAWIAGTVFTVVFALMARRQGQLIDELRAAQAGLADRARVEERNRIARELHDVIGHALTVSQLHVSSARLAVEEDPTQAVASLVEAERLGLQSLREVRQAVGLLREDGDPSATTPLPGAEQLPTLVDGFRRAGVDISYEVVGEPARLPATVAITVYRILQEALTNVARHAAGAATRVRIEVDPAQTVLTVDSMGEAGVNNHGGIGLSTMKERAEVLGGDLAAGPYRPGMAGARGAARRSGRRGATVIRVMLVDDQELVRAGLRGILRARFGFEIVAELSDGAGVVAAVRESRPDVVLMDVRMPGVDGVTATQQLRASDQAPPVLVLTTFEDEEILAGALRAGAAGFLLKGVPVEDLQRAVRTVAEGGAWLDPAVTARVLAAYRDGPVPRAPDPALAVLTPREREVLVLIGSGLSNTEIAEELFLGEGTVKTHVGHVFAKLQLRDRAAAVVFAFDHGLVRPGTGPA